MNKLITLAPVFALALLLGVNSSARAQAQAQAPAQAQALPAHVQTQSSLQAANHSGWSLNFTPVLIFANDKYRFGGGADPELKYTLDFGGARLSAGGRVGSYYAKNLFGITVMPTLRLTVPVGPVEPYAAVGMGYGWLPKLGHEDFATMSRLGIVFRFSKRFAIGLEGTVQKIDGSAYRFPSFGSMMSFDL
jgi:hypothetical protein